MLKSLRLDEPERRIVAVEARPQDRWRTVAFVAIGISALLAALLLYLLLTERSAPDTGPSTPVRASSPAAEGEGEIAAAGHVVARRRATVAAEVTGRLLEMNVREGQVIARGQLIARLDDRLARAD